MHPLSTRVAPPLACLAALLSASRLAAQQEKGDKEVGIGGNLQYLSTKSGGSTTSGSIFGTFGLYLTRHVKVSVGTALQLSNSSSGAASADAVSGATGGGSNTTTSGLATGQVTYYFGGPGAKTYPYLGVGGTTQLSSASGATTSGNVSGVAGLQHFFNRNASLFGEVSYTPLNGVTLVPLSFGLRLVF